jgi:NAD-dependent dihydropyrimidine dehydrogenase PreA subunit
MINESKKNNLYKLIYQFAVFTALAYMGVRLWLDKVYSPDFEAYCPFGGLQAAGSYLTRGSLSCSMTSMQIMMGVMLFVGAFLFSKLFCGYICPLGTLSEWLGKLGDKLRIKISVPDFADSTLRSLKYILLFVTFYFTLTSSELFCKKFDPYYAVASGFNTDVVLLYALIAIGVYVAGSVLFRFFWCKYLCPFSALTNIFRFTWWFAGIMSMFILLSLVGLKIPFIYPLLVITCAGYILEIVMMHKVKPSFVHITRNADTCTSCNICSKSCPQEIEVSKVEKVDHIDCNLCGDCLYACPEKDTIQINRKNMNWLPAFVLTVLIVFGLILGSLFEFPTIDVKWGTKEEIAKAAVFSKEGLKNIKCFGSSTAFANQMRKVDGIFGVSTYVASHTVKILYNKAMYNDTTIQKLLFIPEKRVLAELAPYVDSISVISLTVDRFFDPLDASYLQYLLQQKTDACGYQSDFACPVIIRIYFPNGRHPDMKTLVDIIESESLTYKIDEATYKVKLNYKVITISDKPEVISRIDYNKMVPIGRQSQKTSFLPLNPPRGTN